MKSKETYLIDYLIIALGRRLATERVTGLFEYANHLLTWRAPLILSSGSGCDY